MSSNKEVENKLVVITLVLMFPLMVYGAFFEALAGWQLWQWFLIPLGAPNISGWHIAGLSLVLSFLRYQRKDSKDEGKVERLLKALAESIIYPPFVMVTYLATGFVIAKIAGLV